MLNLLGVLIAFLLVIFLIRKRVNFGFSLILGSVVLGLFSLQIIEITDIFKTMISASFYSFEKHQIEVSTIELAGLMTLMYFLAKSMQELGVVQKLITSFQTLFTKGGILGIIPAVYGLMPIPGGALFSAPLIDEEGTKYRLKAYQKNFLNIWFRHIWFPVYPITASMILICSPEFANVNIFNLVIIHIPVFITSVILGVVFLKNSTYRLSNIVSPPVKYKTGGLIYLLLPVVPLLFYVALQSYGFSQIRSFLIGIGASIFILYLLERKQVITFFNVIKKSVTWNLALAIFGIMIFRDMIYVSKVNIVIVEVFRNLPFPPLLILILIPFLLGILTGFNLGAIALSFPMVEPLFSLVSLSILKLTSIVFMSSVVGYLISPIHLCNVLSSEYLKTDTTRMYTIFIPSALILIIVNTLFLLV
jgi:integral membrane protein (TIGR00529 family)